MSMGFVKRMYEGLTGQRSGWAIKSDFGWWNFEIYSSEAAALKAWRKHCGYGADPQIVRAVLTIKEASE